MFFSYLRTAIWTGPLVVLFTTLFGIADLIVSLLDNTGNWQHIVAQRWSRVLLAVGAVDVKLEGIEKIQANGSYVFASNHLSFADTPIMLANIPCQFRFMAKHSLFKVPFIGYHLRRGGHIPVPREDARAAIRAIQDAGRIIRERQISILLFPEGGRTDGELRPFKEGAALIAIAGGVPIVPVAVDGSRTVMPMGSWRMVPGKVIVRIGDPIPTADLNPRARGPLTDQVRAQVETMLNDIRSFPAQK